MIGLSLICVLAVWAVASPRVAPEETPSPSETPRLLIIGLDAASWDNFEAGIEEGRLPNLAAIRARGAFGALQSFFPTASPVIWTTIVTGADPENHGIGRG